MKQHNDEFQMKARRMDAEQFVVESDFKWKLSLLRVIANGNGCDGRGDEDKKRNVIFLLHSTLSFVWRLSKNERNNSFFNDVIFVHSIFLYCLLSLFHSLCIYFQIVSLTDWLFDDTFVIHANCNQCERERACACLCVWFSETKNLAAKSRLATLSSVLFTIDTNSHCEPKTSNNQMHTTIGNLIHW